MPERELCLLSLDGGGVRGLSTLFILRELMKKISQETPPPKPCDYFDMIGGTSTGGLIAIMLGRLRMTVDESIDAYVQLADYVFQKKRHRVTLKGRVQGRFGSDELEHAIKDILRKKQLDENALMQESPDPRCKVFVCATSREMSSTVLFTTYRSPNSRDDLFDGTTIWQAGRATSAASSFFDPIKIGPHDEEFVDGALGANNPVQEMWNEAQALWPSDNPVKDVRCFVSIGTGVPKVTAFGQDLLDISASLIAMATETERTAETFQKAMSPLDYQNRYFRFNVARGLESIGLEDSSQRNVIAAATWGYTNSGDARRKMTVCTENLRERQSSHCIENLRRAVVQDDLSRVQDIVKSHGASVAVVDEHEKTPLLTAAAYGFFDIVKTLYLADKATIHVRDDKGRTPLFVAASAGHLKVVQFLRRQNEPALHGEDFDGRTPLHVATNNRHGNVVRHLLLFGANPASMDDDGNTAQDYARGILAMDWIFLHGTNIDSRDPQTQNTALLHTAITGDFASAELVIREGADLEAKNRSCNTALLEACISGHYDVARLLLSKGADINAVSPWGLTPLLASTLFHHERVLRLLLDHDGVNTVDLEARYKGETALKHATADAPFEPFVKPLVEHGADVNVRGHGGFSIISRYVIDDRVEEVRYLLEHSIDLKIKNHVGIDAWDEVVNNQSWDVAKLLISKCDDVNSKDSWGYPMICRMAQHGRDDLLCMLIDKGADVNATNRDDWTALNEAISRWSAVGGIKALLDAGANYERCDMGLDNQTGCTYLMHAARQAVCHPAVELLNRKANIEASSSEGWTPLRHAVECQRDNVACLLLLRNADRNVRDVRGKTVLERAHEMEGLPQFLALCAGRPQ